MFILKNLKIIKIFLNLIKLDSKLKVRLENFKFHIKKKITLYL